MIASIYGTVLEIFLDHAIIEAAGIGYKIMATPASLATLTRGEQTRLITAMIVREDSMTLYGFHDYDSRDLFMTLISVSGIGPKTALATLAVHDPDSLRKALTEKDITALTRIPGIGKRSAERLILELADKIPSSPHSGEPSLHNNLRTPVIQALIGLGFSAQQAEEATDNALTQPTSLTTSDTLRAALTILGKTS